MFDYPAYYIRGKLFSCVYENGIGIKLPEQKANQLREQPHIDYFPPLGRKRMREWIQINRENSEDYIKDKKLLFDALEYVTDIAGIQLESKQE
jgi:hypothetical protein